jgi:hypothetical protein
LVIVAKQRSIPGLHFAHRTEDFVKSFGLFEIIIKTVTLGFFLGSIFYIWWSDRELRILKVHVHGYFRFLSIVRKSIIGFLLFGSLMFNIFSYFTSGIEFGVKMCNLGMMTSLANLAYTFEVLKRLNGVYHGFSFCSRSIKNRVANRPLIQRTVLYF